MRFGVSSYGVVGSGFRGFAVRGFWGIVFGIRGFRFGVSGSGFRVSASQVRGFAVRVSGSGFYDSGFWLWGFRGSVLWVRGSGFSRFHSFAFSVRDFWGLVLGISRWGFGGIRVSRFRFSGFPFQGFGFWVSRFGVRVSVSVF